MQENRNFNGTRKFNLLVYVNCDKSDSLDLIVDKNYSFFLF